MRGACRACSMYSTQRCGAYRQHGLHKLLYVESHGEHVCTAAAARAIQNAAPRSIMKNCSDTNWQMNGQVVLQMQS